MSPLTSFAVIFLCAQLFSLICKKLKLPQLLGMLVTGIILGQHVLNIISPSLSAISQDLRSLALVIILTRAGLSLDISQLKKNGRSAVLMCFVPATFEIIGYIVFGVTLLKLSVLNAAILGAVMAAVSSAIVVPRMLELANQGYGKNKGIPELVITGASVDDVFVIVLFTALTNVAMGQAFTFNIIWQVPLSIILGIVVGLIFGAVFAKIFKRFQIRAVITTLLFLSVSLLFIALENLIVKVVPYSSLVSIISMGAVLLVAHKESAHKLSINYSKLWLVAEIILFVLVGAMLDIKYILSASAIIIAVIFLALLFRMAGVFVCMFGSKLLFKERLFCAIAFTPKATVQAAIGAVPLAIGLAGGQIILAVAALGIIITAPLGAFAIEFFYKKLLDK